MTLRALSWNLYHGRDRAPDPALHTWRSRLLRTSERNETHLQVNRDLLSEFTAVLCRAPWDVALLQECPPRWSEPLADGCRAAAHRVLTSRNSLAPLRSLLARLNPDLIASNEGGSNLTLVRGSIVERRELVLRSGPKPERRAMAFTRARVGGEEVCVANLHASAGRSLHALAEEEVLLAAARACEWSAGAPLILGGDLNLRPSQSAIYATLAERFGLRGASLPASLDHLLIRGLEFAAPTAPWAPEAREVPEAERVIRLSDHAPVEAVVRAPQPGVPTIGPGVR